MEKGVNSPLFLIQEDNKRMQGTNTKRISRQADRHINHKNKSNDLAHLALIGLFGDEQYGQIGPYNHPTIFTFDQLGDFLEQPVPFVLLKRQVIRVGVQEPQIGFCGIGSCPGISFDQDRFEQPGLVDARFSRPDPFFGGRIIAWIAPFRHDALVYLLHRCEKTGIGSGVEIPEQGHRSSTLRIQPIRENPRHFGISDLW